jgi:hypothetical protein
MYVSAATNLSMILFMNWFPSREHEQMVAECQSLLSSSIGDQHAPANHLFWMPEIVTHHKQTISSFRQHPIPQVDEQPIMRTARDKKRQFLRVQVTVKVSRDNKLSHYIRLNSACRFNACCTSIVRNCILLLLFPMSDEASWRVHMVLTRYYMQYLTVSDC